MLFSSLEFIFLFLPITLVAYFWAGRRGRRAPLAVLLLASLVFYAYWRLEYLALLLASLAVNYWLGERIRHAERGANRGMLVAGVVANVALLALFKYYNFFAEVLLGFGLEGLPRLGWELPLGISFFTFVQIAYLVDCAKGKVAHSGPLEYSLFVTYFPHLIAGPIVHHSDLMPQFFQGATRRFFSENFARGLFLFALGLCKKTLLADNLSGTVAIVFDDAPILSLAEAWLGALGYTLQLYFDFSGYSDMAMGASVMMNINLPQNFDSPYRAAHITEFWRRWHMTLSRWLRDYVYIPLGGNRGGLATTYRNLFLTFLVGGIWHGAGYTFLLWGAAHGLALVAHKEFQRRGGRLPLSAAIALTFLFNIFCWVLFRARSLNDAGKVFYAMLGQNGLRLDEFWGFPNFNKLFPFTIFMCVLGSAIVFTAPNSTALSLRFAPRRRWAAVLALLLIAGIISANTSISQEFLYFDF
ncbi:MAG: MBOAT family protein [Proteobacteria bacterium]|nr:MAG: MBOAT family protein [Pseudomonadota bacterium]